MNAKRSLLLISPAILAMALDAGLTLRGQGAEFWSGQFGTAAEATRTAASFLSQGPLIFLTFVIGYALVCLAPAFVVGLFSTRAATIFVIYLTICHLIGAASWLGIFLPGGLGAVEVYSILPALAWFIL